MSTGTAATATRTPPRSNDNWLNLDWLMKALSLAHHQASVAGQADIAERLGELHELALARRDRA